MEKDVSWHGKAPNDEEYQKAIDELVEREKEIDRKMVSESKN